VAPVRRVARPQADSTPTYAIGGDAGDSTTRLASTSSTACGPRPPRLLLSLADRSLRPMAAMVCLPTPTRTGAERIGALPISLPSTRTTAPWGMPWISRIAMRAFWSYDFPFPPRRAGPLESFCPHCQVALIGIPRPQPAWPARRRPGRCCKHGEVMGQSRMTAGTRPIALQADAHRPTRLDRAVVVCCALLPLPRPWRLGRAAKAPRTMTRNAVCLTMRGPLDDDSRPPVHTLSWLAPPGRGAQLKPR